MDARTPHAADMCAVCPRRHANARNIHGARITYAAPSGPNRADVMLIGDAPDGNANRRGLAWAGKVGRELDDCYLPHAGLERSQVYVTYAMKCQRPDGETPAPDEARVCAQHWLPREMEAVQPWLVVAAGGVAAKVAVDKAESSRVDMATYHGQLYGQLEYRQTGPGPGRGPGEWIWGFKQPRVLGEDGKFLVLVTAPSAGFVGGSLMGDVLSDFASLGAIIAHIRAGRYPHEIDQYPFAQYAELTTPEQVRFALDPAYSLTDGLTGPPWCLSFSTAPGTGWVIPADARPAVEEFGRLVRPNGWVKVLLHNALFDVDVLARMGVEGFEWRDTMHTAYQLGTQPQGLKALAWRLCGMEMVDYSEVVRVPSVPPVLDWMDKVRRAVVAAIPTKQPRKKLVLGPDHKYWKKHGGLLDRRRVLLRDWQIGQLFPGEVGKDFPDPWKWWEEREPAVRAALGMFGEGGMPQESIVHVERGRAVQYAGRDADATLRSWVVLRRLVRALAKRVPPQGYAPRKTW
jgi:uracil-DNA glycosylase family 4